MVPRVAGEGAVAPGDRRRHPQSAVVGLDSAQVRGGRASGVRDLLVDAVRLRSKQTMKESLHFLWQGLSLI